MSGRMLTIRALSPIHSGTGQASGVIDLPVARERITNWPFLPGSSLKGVLRDACDPGGAYANGKQRADQRVFDRAFGPPTEHAGDFAGALTFCDAHLLCFPVRSFYGTFAWITSPLALSRWVEDYTAAGLTVPAIAVPAPGSTGVRVAPGSKLIGPGDLANRVFLEDLDLTVEASPGPPETNPVRSAATAIAATVFDDQSWRDHFVERFAIVTDDLFTAITETATEVATRVRLDDKSKTVARGALWSEEAVPAQAIFTAPVLVERRFTDEAATYWDFLTEPLTRPLQVGGHASVGRGLVWCRCGGEGATS